MENENKNVANELSTQELYSRREFLKKSRDALVMVGMMAAMSKFDFILEADAAAVTNEALYSQFVNDFISGTFVKDAGKNKGINFEWIYFKNGNDKTVPINVRNNYHQCVITDAKHNPIIYNYYINFINKVRSTKTVSDSDFRNNVGGNYIYFPGNDEYSEDNKNQRNFLNQCENKLYNVIKNDVIKSNDLSKTLPASVDFFRFIYENMVCPGALFSLSNGIQNIPLYETVSEMVQAAWDKVSAIDYAIQHTKPKDLGPKAEAEGACVQDIVATLCGNRTRGTRTASTLRHSGTQKGTSGDQMQMFVDLNNYSYNHGVACSIVAWAADYNKNNPSDPYTDEDLMSFLFIDRTEFNSILNDIKNNKYQRILSGFEMTNSNEETNSVKDKLHSRAKVTSKSRVLSLAKDTRLTL